LPTATASAPTTNAGCATRSLRSVTGTGCSRVFLWLRIGEPGVEGIDWGNAQSGIV